MCFIVFRLLETEKVIGAVLVSPCVTDLGDVSSILVSN